MVKMALAGVEKCVRGAGKPWMEFDEWGRAENLMYNNSIHYSSLLK